MPKNQPEPLWTPSADFYDLIAPIYDHHWARRFFPSASRKFRDHIAPRVFPQARILDLCCGSGRFAGYLGRAKYRVTGIDSSAELLAEAAERAPLARLVLADMSAFSITERFDAVVCWYNSLNHAEDEAGLAAIFSRVADHLAPSGHFLFDLMAESEYLSTWNGDEYIRWENTMYELTYSYARSSKTARCRVRIRSRRELKYIDAEAVSEQRPFALSAVKDALHLAGLRLEFVKEFRRPYAPDGRLLVLAKRR